MNSLNNFKKVLTKQELKIFNGLDSPEKIQSFLDSIIYSSEPVYRNPLQVLRDKMGHCFDGALFAAAALSNIGSEPLIIDMIPNERDDDHLLALFKHEGHWGAIAKSNFVGLRYREPIFRNIRELVLTYFEQYYNVDGEKTLRGYTTPLNLNKFDSLNWMTETAPLDLIAAKLDKIKRFSLLTPKMEEALSKVDDRLFNAGLQGANEDGLFKPSNYDK